MNIKTWFEQGALHCTTKEAAAQWFEREVTLVRAATGVDVEQAEDLIKQHLGYVSGYYNLEVARRIYEFWGAEHPFFGTPDEREKYTPEELLALGQAYGAIASGNVDGVKN